MNKKKNLGRVTLPMDSDINVTAAVVERWGADAIRDCDGTEIDDAVIALGLKVYKTYFVTRGDNAFASENRGEGQHFFVMSKPCLAVAAAVEVDILDGYFAEQIAPEYDINLKKYWQVIDRTTGETVTDWNIDRKKHTVIINNSVPYHSYTVAFMAKTLWDSTQMYNYITNNWTKEKEIPYDPRYPQTAKYILSHMSEWLAQNPGISVVRFTTFLYHFALLFNDKKKEKFVDWFGYSATVSPLALEQFAKEYGYELTPEDFVDEGYYNSTFRNPSKHYLDYMDFLQRFVSGKAKELVDIVHSAGREAMMFLGDTWIGTEPYGKYFEGIGLDAVVGSVGGGVTVRMLTDIKGVKYVEGRFLPYFFPDTFFDGNDPCIELNKNWLTARRAMMRKPLDRIGYGGYLGLANKFPKFIDRVSQIADEFRMLYDNIHGSEPHNTIKVAVLNGWGALRSWQAFMVAHELWYQQNYTYQGILESLSGLPVSVSFISFDDVIGGIDLKNYDVIINAGNAGTAFSGGEYWKNATLVTAIRKFVYEGGGFVGIGEPTAIDYNGKFFQLSDVLGVDQERGYSLSTNKYNIAKQKHFITEDLAGAIDYGEGTKNIYAADTATVLDIDICDRVNRKVNIGEVKLSVNNYGKGKGVYLAGLPFSFQNSRLLYKACMWASGKQADYYKAYSTNPATECHYYPAKNVAVGESPTKGTVPFLSETYALVNNTTDTQQTTFYNINGAKTQITLTPMQIQWIAAKE